MSVPYPERGSGPWDMTLRAYIDAIGDEAVEASVGAELAYAARLTNFTTTNANSASTSGDIPGMVCIVEGAGRPVEVMFNASAVYHSVANGLVAVSITCNDNAADPVGSGLGSQQSTATNAGPSLVVRRRTQPLIAGVTYTFKPRVWLGAAGTGTLVAAAQYPIELSVTGR